MNISHEMWMQIVHRVNNLHEMWSSKIVIEMYELSI